MDLDLKYVGTVAIHKKGQRNRPTILSMDWSGCPLSYGVKSCQDIVACIGPDGLYIYLRQITAEERGKHEENLLTDMEYGWKLMSFHADIKGSLCRWNPEVKATGTEQEGGHLVVATMSNEDTPAQVLMLTYYKKRQLFGHKCIYKADHLIPGCRDNICDIFWTHGGADILIFQENSRGINSLRWDRRQVTWHHNVLYPDGNDTIYNWIGCPKLDCRQFVTCHTDSHFLLYEPAPEGSHQHWELVNLVNDVMFGQGTTAMCFSKDSDWLAALTIDNTVMIWRFYVIPVPQHLRYGIKLGYIIEQHDQPPIYMTWLRHHTLVLGRGELQSVAVYTRHAFPLKNKANKEEEEGEEMMEQAYNDIEFLNDLLTVTWERDQQQKMNMKGVAPFNRVEGLTGHPRKTHVLCVNGENPFIHMWKNGNAKISTRQRSFHNERRFDIPPRTNVNSLCVPIQSALDRLAVAVKEAKKTYKDVNEILLEAQEVEDSHVRLEEIDVECAKILNQVYDGDLLDDRTYITSFENVSNICKFEEPKNTRWKLPLFGDNFSDQDDEE